jgi:hypothetical protein
MPPMYVRWSPQWSANDSCENPSFFRSSRIRFPSTFCSSFTFNSLRRYGLCVYRVLEDMIDIAVCLYCHNRGGASARSDCSVRWWWRTRRIGRPAIHNPSWPLKIRATATNRARRFPLCFPSQENGFVQEHRCLLGFSAGDLPRLAWRSSIPHVARYARGSDGYWVDLRDCLCCAAAAASGIGCPQGGRSEHRFPQHGGPPTPSQPKSDNPGSAQYGNS